MGKKQITLNEENLRNFISYSVARLLKEAYGKPIYDAHGEFDGYEDSKYGFDNMKIDFDPFEDDGMMSAFESVLESGKYPGLSKEMFDDYEDGQFGRIWPVKVEVNYDVKQGAKGDGYLTPDDPDEINVTGWNIIDDQNKFGEAAGLVKDVIDTYFRDGYFDADEVIGDSIAGLNEENRGVMAHFSGDGFQPENPYKDMTWDEYCEAKRKEREDEKKRKELEGLNKFEEPGKPNLGVTTHFDGKDSFKLSSDELKEMIAKEICQLKEGMEGGEEEQVQDMFPKKASGKFKMNTRRGTVDQYRVFVEKTDDEELLTDIFVYDPMDKEWYPQAEYVVGIEEYLNGSWLPYWETFNGDVSIRALANCFSKVVKLWKKVGYLYEEDDEIPFRYAGDIKGLNGKMY